MVGAMPLWSAFGQEILSTNLAVNSVIPDNDANGLASSFTVSGLSAPIANVTVTLDITGGFNGDLYAYLAGPGDGFAVLLNRVGMNGGNAFGYGDTGFNITLDDSGGYNNVHDYQTYSPVINGLGQLTLTWASDGENIDPQSLPGSFPAASTATLSSFAGADPNGQWVFFVADLSSGGQSTLTSVGVTIAMVPEPSAWVLFGCGLALMLGIQKRRKVV